MRTVDDVFSEAIGAFEGGFQAIPNDKGNWVTMPDGSRRLIGTMRGVTPGALAEYLGVPAHTITVEQIKNVSHETAVDIGVKNYYHRPGFDKLPWCPLTEAVVDTGWGSGPARAARMLQQMVDTAADGIIGPLTIDAVWNFLLSNGHWSALDAFAARREAFYLRISRPGTSNAIFRNGWLRRARYYKSNNTEFTSKWRDLETPQEMYERLSDKEIGADEPSVPSIPYKPREELPATEVVKDEVSFWQRILDWITK